MDKMTTGDGYGLGAYRPFREKKEELCVTELQTIRDRAALVAAPLPPRANILGTGRALAETVAAQMTLHWRDDARLEQRVALCKVATCKQLLPSFLVAQQVADEYNPVRKTITHTSAPLVESIKLIMWAHIVLLLPLLLMMMAAAVALGISSESCWRQLIHSKRANSAPSCPQASGTNFRRTRAAH